MSLADELLADLEDDEEEEQMEVELDEAQPESIDKNQVKRELLESLKGTRKFRSMKNFKNFAFRELKCP